jgi:8-oxo-dGTP pyrophosphatase MutT (NUDIX family)
MIVAGFEMGKPILFAGGIVVRLEKRKPQVLIVTARKRRKRWVLPKGRVQDGERASSAALREVREEAGVTGRVLGLAGTAEYPTREGRIRVDYYLIEYTRPCIGGDEDRDTRWCPVEDAIAMLTYASARKVLLDVNGKIARYARNGSKRVS